MKLDKGNSLTVVIRGNEIWAEIYNKEGETVETIPHTLDQLKALGREITSVIKCIEEKNHEQGQN